MPGVTADGSEDRPNRKETLTEAIEQITRYDCDITFDDCSDYQYAEMTPYDLGEFVRFEDHMEALREATAPKPSKDYLKQKLDNVYCELKIISDNIQLLQPHHSRQLIELNSMIANILTQQMLVRRAHEEKVANEH